MIQDKSVYRKRVYRTSDKRLYLTGGSNSVTSLYTDEGFAAAVDCRAWNQRINERQTRIQAGDCRFLQLIVPEKLSVYPLARMDQAEVFPGYADKELIPPGRRLINSIGDSGIIYPDHYLRTQCEHFDIFPMTDSHWTWKGAFSAFQLLMSAAGYKLNYNRFLMLPTFNQRYHGDLWEPRDADIPPEQMERIRLPETVRRIYANSLMGLKESQNLEDEGGLHQGSHCIFSNVSAEIDQTIILFGSSFSEARLAPSLLTAIFSFYFRTVHFIWSPSVDLPYVLRHGAALVIAETPERFLNDCPKDELSVEQYAVRRIQNWNEKIKNGFGTEKGVLKDHATENANMPQSPCTSYADFPLWEKQLEECCRLIETPVSVLKVLLKTKNDSYFLEKWILHHLKIVGNKNIIVFDNMSDNADVLAVYLKYQDVITIIRFNTFHNWVHHTEIYPRLYASLAKVSEFFVFLDSDEFLVLNENGRLFNDAALVGFLERNHSDNVFPGLWLNNTDWNPSRFICGTTTEDLVQKAAWGKPVIRSNAGAKGFLNHNAFLDRAFFERTLKPNIFVLHMTNLSVIQRIHANVNKLIARGFGSPGDSIKTIMSRSREGITDFNIHLYIEELSKLLLFKEQPTCGSALLRAGCFEVSGDLAVRYYSDVEQQLIAGFLNDPTEVFSKALDVADKRDERINPGAK